MATITGSVGIDFDLTLTDTSTLSGNKIVETKVSSNIASLSVSNTDKIACLIGTVGTTTMTIDLTNVDDVSDSGSPAKYLRLQDNTSPIQFSTIKSIVIHNGGLSSINDPITIAVSSNPFFPTGNIFKIECGEAIQCVYSATKVVDSTHKEFTLATTTSLSTAPCYIYIIGT